MKPHCARWMTAAIIVALALAITSCYSRRAMQKNWDFFCETAETVLAEDSLTLEEQREQFARIIFDRRNAYHSRATVRFLDGCSLQGFWCYNTFKDHAQHFIKDRAHYDRDHARSHARIVWHCPAIEALLKKCPWE